MADVCEYTFLLIGKTFDGASALGNAIRGKSVIVGRDGAYSNTISVSQEKRFNHTFCVVDIPGVMSTAEDVQKLSTYHNVKQALEQCPSTGKIVIVYVFRYGERFTRDRQATLSVVKTIFGEENLKKYCIVCLTHGDDFYLEYEGAKSVDEWCREETSEAGSLFELVNYRCVMFDNVTDNKEQCQSQFMQLLTYAAQLPDESIKKYLNTSRKMQNRFELESKLVPTKENFNKTIKFTKEKIANVLHAVQVQQRVGQHQEIEVGKLEVEIETIVKEIHQEDNVEKIEYVSGEKHLLHDVSDAAELVNKDLTNLKKYINNVKTINSWIQEMELVLSQLKTWCVDNVSSEEIKKLQEKVDEVRTGIEEKGSDYTRSSVLDSLLLRAQREIDDLKERVRKFENTSRLQERILRLELEIWNIRYPVLKKKNLENILNEAVVILDNINSNDLTDDEKLYLPTKMEDLINKINFMQDQNSIAVKWTAAVVGSSAASIPIAFIPVVGMAVSAALNGVPYLGQTAHMAFNEMKRNYMLKEKLAHELWEVENESNSKFSRFMLRLKKKLFLKKFKS